MTYFFNVKSNKEKPNKSTNKDIIYNDLRNKIQKGELLPGEWLVEREISAKYDLSRTPLREILWHLEKDGLIIQVPGKGFCVKELSLQEIMEIFQARAAVEGMAAFLVSNIKNDEFFEQITSLRCKMETIDSEDLQVDGPTLGDQMHKLIINHVKNSLLKDFYDKLHNLYSLTVNITRKSLEIESISRDSHIAIMKAIEKHDGELAEKLMKEHLNNTSMEIIKIFYPNLSF